MMKPSGAKVCVDPNASSIDSLHERIGQAASALSAGAGLDWIRSVSDIVALSELHRRHEPNCVIGSLKVAASIPQ